MLIRPIRFVTLRLFNSEPSFQKSRRTVKNVVTPSKQWSNIQRIKFHAPLLDKFLPQFTRFHPVRRDLERLSCRISRTRVTKKFIRRIGVTQNDIIHSFEAFSTLFRFAEIRIVSREETDTSLTNFELKDYIIMINMINIDKFCAIRIQIWNCTSLYQTGILLFISVKIRIQTIKLILIYFF